MFLEKLLFLKALAMEIPKYHRDLALVVEKVLQEAYKDTHTQNAVL